MVVKYCLSALSGRTKAPLQLFLAVVRLPQPVTTNRRVLSHLRYLLISALELSNNGAELKWTLVICRPSLKSNLSLKSLLSAFFVCWNTYCFLFIIYANELDFYFPSGIFAQFQ